MSSFISSLINRHTLKSDIVKPRLMTMFESESRNTGMADVNESNADVFNVDKTRDKPNFKNAAIQDLKAEDVTETPVNTTLKPTAQLKNSAPDEVVDKPKTYTIIESKSADEHLQPRQVSDFIDNNAPEVADSHFPIENNGKVNPAKSGMITNEPVSHSTAFPIPKEENVLDKTQPSTLKKTADEPVLLKSILKVDTYSQSAYFTKALPLKDTLHPEAKKPSIKVTIGQIDVKAISDIQPARIKNKTTEAPRMSLDDYLKMRNSN